MLDYTELKYNEHYNQISLQKGTNSAALNIHIWKQNSSLLNLH